MISWDNLIFIRQSKFWCFGNLSMDVFRMNFWDINIKCQYFLKEKWRTFSCWLFYLQILKISPPFYNLKHSLVPSTKKKKKKKKKKKRNFKLPNTLSLPSLANFQTPNFSQIPHLSSSLIFCPPSFSFSLPMTMHGCRRDPATTTSTVTSEIQVLLGFLSSSLFFFFNFIRFRFGVC